VAQLLPKVWAGKVITTSYPSHPNTSHRTHFPKPYSYTTQNHDAGPFITLTTSRGRTTSLSSLRRPSFRQTTGGNVVDEIRESIYRACTYFPRRESVKDFEIAGCELDRDLQYGADCF